MNKSSFSYPNRLVQALFLALEQTAGPSSLTSVLELAGLTAQLQAWHRTSGTDWQGTLNFAEIAAFNNALEELYGSKGGRGIALRAGMVFFELGFKGVGVLGGVNSPEFARLTVLSQAHISLLGLAALFNQETDQSTQLHVTPDAFQVWVNPSPFAWERTSDKPVCHVLAGTLQAHLRWATRGYEFAVHETACRAAGAETCVFHISKKPIGRV